MQNLPELSVPTFVTTLVAMLTITNPLAAVPMFLAVSNMLTPQQMRRRGIWVGVATWAVLMISLLAGRAILDLFDIDETAFQIAGFLLVSTVAWAMVTSKQYPIDTTSRSSPVVVPLAIPMVAGPGAIGLMIATSSTYQSMTAYLLGIASITIVGISISACFYFAPMVARLLGESGLKVLTQILGLILLSIAVQKILTAVLSWLS